MIEEKIHLSAEARAKKTMTTIVKWSVGTVVVLILLAILNPLVKIDAGERGVVLNMGQVSDIVLGEGLHWKIPIYQNIEKIDTRIQKEDNTATASSGDLQTVSSQITINYHLDPLKVNTIFQTLGRDWSARIINPAIQEFVKKTTAQYTAEELITRREDVKESLRISISEDLAINNIIVDNIFITDFNFSASFNSAIEAKVTAEQSALEQKNKLEQVKYEAEQRVAEAQAEAEAIKLQSDAANNDKYIELRKLDVDIKALEVQLEAVKVWDGKLPTQMIPGATVPFLNLSN